MALTKETTVCEATSVVSVVSEHKANTVSRRNDFTSQNTCLREDHNFPEMEFAIASIDRVVQSGMKCVGSAFEASHSIANACTLCRLTQNASPSHPSPKF